MVLIITLVGVVLVFIGILSLEKKNTESPGGITTIRSLISVGGCILTVVIILFDSGLIPNGSPLVEISNGSYIVVSSAKVLREKERYICLVLKQTGKNDLYCYLLPEDRVIKESPTAGLGTLEVTTKQGIKKVVLSCPLSQ